MTLEEALTLAENGDQDAICALGHHYYEEKDYDESLKWYTIGADLGNTKCMLLSAILGNILGHASRKVDPTNTKSQFDHLYQALSWGTKALENGIEEARKQINISKGELGIAFYYLAMSTHSLEDYLQSASLLKESYPESSDPEVPLFLAFSSYNYLMHSKSKNEKDYRLVVDLLTESVARDDLDFKGIAYAYLGNIFTFGNAGTVDYDRAVKYYELAGNNGFDCSDMLSRFRKKFFGGYRFQ